MLLALIFHKSWEVSYSKSQNIQVTKRTTSKHLISWLWNVQVPKRLEFLQHKSIPITSLIDFGYTKASLSWVNDKFSSMFYIEWWKEPLPVITLVTGHDDIIPTKERSYAVPHVAFNMKTWYNF